jgi:hypothetical protein
LEAKFHYQQHLPSIAKIYETSKTVWQSCLRLFNRYAWPFVLLVF